MSNVYKGEFKDWTDVIDNFNIGGDFRYMAEPTYVYAVYAYRDWDGDAQVVFSYDKKHWYFVTGSHCSCHDLEDQWDVEDFDPSMYIKTIVQGRKTIDITDENEFLRWLKSIVT